MIYYGLLNMIEAIFMFCFYFLLLKSDSSFTLRWKLCHIFKLMFMSYFSHFYLQFWTIFCIFLSYYCYKCRFGHSLGIFNGTIKGLNKNRSLIIQILAKTLRISHHSSQSLHNLIFTLTFPLFQHPLKQSQPILSLGPQCLQIRITQPIHSPWLQ